MLVVAGAFVIINNSSQKRKDKTEQLVNDEKARLQIIINDVNQDVSDKKYDDALLKTNSINWFYEPDANKGNVDQYNSQRENLRNTIEQLKANQGLEDQKQAKIVPQKVSFIKYSNSRYNYQIEYPKDILFEQREASNIDGSFFKTKQGIEKLRVYGSSNIENETTNEIGIDIKYDEELLNYSQNRSTITYKKLGKSFFVISGYENGEIFYLKVIETKDYGGYDAFAYAILKYNENEKDFYNKVSEYIFKSFISVR